MSSAGQSTNLIPGHSSNRKRRRVMVAPSFAPPTPASNLPQRRRVSRIDRRSRLFPLLEASSLPIPEISAEPLQFPSADPSTAPSLTPDPSILPARQPQFTRTITHGLPDYECQFCGARFWYEERLSRHRSTTPIYTMCCQKGRVRLPFLQETPPYLEQLLGINGGPMAVHFREHIRSYNAAFSFTSFGAQLDARASRTRGPYSFVICGENYHCMGSLLPVDGQRPRYSQLYVFDPHTELADRLHHFSLPDASLRPDIVSGLMKLFDVTNELVKSFRRIRSQLADPVTANMRLRIVGARDTTNRQYDLPTGSELAGLIPGDFVPDKGERDIIIDHRSEGLKRITSVNPKFDALHFPVLFPYGEDGFHVQIPYDPVHVPATLKRKYITQREYYAFRLQHRDDEGQTLMRGGKALQHYIVDAFSTVEQNRLYYLRTHQEELRAELYQGLTDAFDRGDVTGDDVGHVVLPSSYTGSPRYMKQLYLDAMAVVHHHGSPDLFITFTCNSQWPEITESFRELCGTRSELKPQIVARVFRMKLNDLEDELTRSQFFGKTVAGIKTVEFQKRGLPHVHILLWLDEKHKLNSAVDIDATITAELPDPEQDPVGYEMATKFMLHGPCGSDNPSNVCMKDGSCSKIFPKSFNSETTTDQYGYTVYRRRDTGISAPKGSAVLDNRYIVPYNRNLLVLFQAHINVELCHQGRLIKYLFKYITKGPDRSMVVAESHDQPSSSSTVTGPPPPIDEIK
ncbi:unnamed protein product [Linum trigynum]|uniref:C2H2-type domain-containing protein n=1 Tax=Linum trigynum TaxID=586398 RepID=A0AAV2FF26_9ROSI